MYHCIVLMLLPHDSATFSSCLWSTNWRSFVQFGGRIFILEPKSHLENGTETVPTVVCALEYL